MQVILQARPGCSLKKVLCVCRARTGGVVTKCVFAFVHTAVHLLVALMLMVLLELGVETCIRSPHISCSQPLGLL